MGLGTGSLLRLLKNPTPSPTPSHEGRGRAHPPPARGRDPGVQIIHRGKYESLSDHEKRLLKRRQAIEPLIGHTKADHRMDRCWLQGAMGDALHALSCAAGYNIRWLLRAIVRLGLKGLFYVLSAVLACLACLSQAMAAPINATASARSPQRRPPHRLPLSSLAALG